MNTSDLIKEMADIIGKKEPVAYFQLLTAAFGKLFEQLNKQDQELSAIKTELNKVKTQSALAIQWEPKVAAEMLSKQIDIMRADKDTYFQELSDFKKAYTDDRVTQNYHDFVKFWVETLGVHPFLDL